MYSNTVFKHTSSRFVAKSSPDLEEWQGENEVREEGDQGGDEDSGGRADPRGAAHQDVAGRRQEGLDVENTACCGVKTESHHGAREAVLVTITGHYLFETYLKENIYQTYGQAMRWYALNGCITPL